MKTTIRIYTKFSYARACIRFWVLGSICFLTSFSFTQQSEAQISSDVSPQFVCQDESVVSVPQACLKDNVRNFQGASGDIQDISAQLQVSFEASAPAKVFFDLDGFTISDAARESLTTQVAWLSLIHI